MHCRGRCGHTETSERTAAPGPSPRRPQKPLSHPTQSATAREEQPLLAQGRDPADFRAMSPRRPPKGAVGAELAISDDARLWPCGSCSMRSRASRLTCALAASGAGYPDPIRTAEDQQNTPPWRARAEAAGGSAGGLQSPRIPGETARQCPCGPALLGWGSPLHPARPVTLPRLSPGLGSPPPPGNLLGLPPSSLERAPSLALGFATGRAGLESASPSPALPTPAPSRRGGRAAAPQPPERPPGPGWIKARTPHSSFHIRVPEAGYGLWFGDRRGRGWSWWTPLGESRELETQLDRALLRPPTSRVGRLRPWA
ncbi:basic salivary proline-rich protein 1-like [Rhinopithecus roxellana]|uniref:basic salivary proline-rich protein 1-like n=1 Tax=Rhinopithecus roxellana TaxID=61622 RepID=UPI001237323E|nr:basic salivary proline-rich protein 1-like [Rhinopithecus roxellana]